ncbi:MAG: hypothetical protein DRQ98_09010 [Gammaproteobacteria bacterium]|nr:MAG: hypothetical protein DRQ98_09010 [Gammaproteobacteria bacterium]
MDAEFLKCQSRGNYFLAARFFLTAAFLAAGFFFAGDFLAAGFFLAAAFLAAGFFLVEVFFLLSNFFSSCSVCLASARINLRIPFSVSLACF